MIGFFILNNDVVRLYDSFLTLHFSLKVFFYGLFTIIEFCVYSNSNLPPIYYKYKRVIIEVINDKLTKKIFYLDFLNCWRNTV